MKDLKVIKNFIYTKKEFKHALLCDECLKFRWVVVKCECGNVRVVPYEKLVSGEIKSCGECGLE